MKPILYVLAVVLLAGCGADTVSSAATAAALEKQQAEEGKKTMDRMQKRINAAMDQAQQSAQRAADAADNN